MDWLIDNWQNLVAAVGGLVIAARIIVILTPTPKDNKVVENIVRFLKQIGLHVKDEE